MKVKRQTHFSKLGAKIRLYVGKDHRLDLQNGQEISIDLADKKESLRIRHSLQKPIVVEDKDSLLIVDNPINVISFWFGVLLVLGSHVIFDFDSKILIYLTAIGLGLIIISYLIPRFKWQKIK
ncbi:hypothetical protein [Streptococcus catagoni]|uniref:hypothetical protein n=1 Tax=Streptococcus catagoni TaxID=2654874 RepID=UPI00140D97AD|nr:hypothetical protein [Streptococcus catagoni]